MGNFYNILNQNHEQILADLPCAFSRLLLRLCRVCGLEPVHGRRRVAVLGTPALDLEGPLAHGVEERPGIEIKYELVLILQEYLQRTDLPSGIWLKELILSMVPYLLSGESTMPNWQFPLSMQRRIINLHKRDNV